MLHWFPLAIAVLILASGLIPDQPSVTATPGPAPTAIAASDADDRATPWTASAVAAVSAWDRLTPAPGVLVAASFSGYAELALSPLIPTPLRC